MDQGLGEQGLTRSRAEVIWRLHHLGPVTQRALSEAMRCTPRNVTGIVDALEATGHVARRPHPSDRRATLVTLTGRGRATAVAWQSAHQELAARALANLEDAQIAGLTETLDHMLGNLLAPGSGPMPLSARAADAVRAQQAGLAREFPDGTPWLFPSDRDPGLPVAYGTLRGVFNAWQERIGLHDQAGRPLHVTLHQLRHTFGTRLINSGVPQHVIQRLLCHASPEMTNFYAHLHDSTIRAEFERYCQTRVGIDGKLLGFDPGAATADAEWVKHRISRAADTLPNGYCGRPPQQDCPHPNACLTCPDFQTTAEFLPIHREHARQARALLADADAAGRERLAANHRKVLINLDKIIASLEALRREAGHGDA